MTATDEFLCRPLQRNATLKHPKHRYLHFGFNKPTLSYQYTHTRPLVYDPHVPCDVARQSGGSTQIPSLTGSEPKAIETEAIEPKTSSPEELSLTGILGQIRIKYRKDLCETTGKILSSTIWMNLEKLVLRCPTSSHRCIPIMARRKALQTRILKMESYEKCRLHHGIYRVEGLRIISNTNCFGETCCNDTGEGSKCKAYSS